MEFAVSFGGEAEVELIFQAEFEARFAQRAVAVLRAGMALRLIGSVGGEFVGDGAFFDILLVEEPEVCLGRDVAEHGVAITGGHDSEQ